MEKETVKIPLHPAAQKHIIEEKHNKKYKVEKELPIRNLIGSLMYIALRSRPDIAYAVSFLSRYVTECTKQVFRSAITVLKYLISTPDYGIQIRTDTRHYNKLELYVDANFAEHPQSLQSNTGYIVLFNENIIKYKAKKQKMTARSTTEAEYIALDTAIYDLLCIYNTLKELKLVNDETSIHIYCDNQPAIDAIQNEKNRNQGGTKHLNIK